MLFRRWACEQVDPGNAPPDPAAQALLLALGEAPEANRVPGALQLRRFVDAQGKPPHAGLYEIAAPVPAPAGLRLYRAYRP